MRADSVATSASQLTAIKNQSPSSLRPESRWMLLIHQIPPTPAYFRVKIGRHLARIGAVPVKNSVYVLPSNDETQEDFHWVLGEIVKGGGDASLVEARFVEGLSDEQLVAMFQSAREADYREVAEQARGVSASLPRKGPIPADRRAEVARQVGRLRQRTSELSDIDFFGAPGRELVEGMLSGLEARMQTVGDVENTRAPLDRAQYRARTWVTRTGIKVDRMASAWLIRRFIDPEPRFKFVPAKGYRPEPDELRFDMFESEVTHEGELCTFEVLVQRFGLADPALRAIAEIVHDIDVKDAKYGPRRGDQALTTLRRSRRPMRGVLISGVVTARRERWPRRRAAPVRPREAPRPVGAAHSLSLGE